MEIEIENVFAAVPLPISENFLRALKFLKTLVRMTVRAVADKNINETQELVQ